MTLLVTTSSQGDQIETFISASIEEWMRAWESDPVAIPSQRSQPENELGVNPTSRDQAQRRFSRRHLIGELAHVLPSAIAERGMDRGCV